MTAMTLGPDAYQHLSPHTAGRLRLLRVGPVEADLDGRLIRLDGTSEPLVVPMKEFDLLTTLMDNAGRVMGRRELLDAVWGAGYPDGNKTLEVHVKRLRERLSGHPAAHARLRTVRGIGYIYDLDT
jgi:two-component system response regulator RegX3